MNMPNQDPSGWWNPAAFTPNETYAFGDVAVRLPEVQVGNRNFGIISGAGRPRNLQIGLKFIF